MATALLSFIVLTLCTLCAYGDDAFVSIDCGSSDSYKDENLIVWSGDSAFVKNGESRTVESNNSISHVMDTLRVFTDRKKNCYDIDSVKRGRVLVRASFYYGDYDKKSSPPSFELQFDGNHWGSVSTSITNYVYYEVTYVMKKDNISVCVAQTKEDQFPFISAIEIRSLESHMYSYIDVNYPLFLMRRDAYAANATIRFTDDPYDRIWRPVTAGNGYTELHNDNIISNPGWVDIPPPAVLKNAITPINPNSSLILFMGFPPFNVSVYINWYFSEVIPLQPNQNRTFQIFKDNTPFSSPISPPYLNFTQLYVSNHIVSSNNTFSLVPTNYSTLPPLINAMEVFLVGDMLSNGTNAADVNGLASLQSNFEVLQGWKGDPCLPLSYSWDWINCSSDSTPRVTALFLGSFGLTGLLPDFSSLDQLETIDLHNNSLNGSIPSFFGTLPNLKELNLANNKFSGPIPSSLSQRNGLNLVVTGNPDLCTSGKPCTASDTSNSRNSSGRDKKIDKFAILLGVIILSLTIIWDDRLLS